MMPQTSPSPASPAPLARPLPVDFKPREKSLPVVWRISDCCVDYFEALAFMEARAQAIARGRADEMVWLLEHAPLYTAGTSARPEDLIDPRFPVHAVGRGGQYTYHGPGQRIAYVMLDLKRRRQDVRAFVGALEHWILRALLAFNVRGETRPDRVGVWVRRPEKPSGPGGLCAEDKIAAIGVRLRHWTSFHGLALNVAPDLSHFSGIAPCGVRTPHYGVTSLADLGLTATMFDVDLALRENFEAVFGPTVSLEERQEI